MLIPIGTEFRTRRPPIANWVLIGLNVLIYLYTDHLGQGNGAYMKAVCSLDAARPSLYQYLTYQFLHADVWHLAGNMLFLWIFGNAVCDRMGATGYWLFYLAGGVFAGFAFTLGADNPILGASGAIATVTTAFLTLFPRVHVTMLVWMFFIFTFQVPAIILIVFKIILWDNIVAPSLNQGAVSSVAYSAHLGGYAFGFAVAMSLLALRVLPRNPFDLVALWDRWRRRRGLIDSRPVPHRAVIARPVAVEEVDSRPMRLIPPTEVEQLREDIAKRMGAGELPTAGALYLRLLELDPSQVLPRPQQLEIANYLAQARRHEEAAHAYEAFLVAYPGAPDAPQVRLFLGLIYSRYLARYDRTVHHLREALESLQLDAQRTLAEEELRRAEGHLSNNDGGDN